MGRFCDYLQSISRVNDLGNNLEWLFYCGMLFSSEDKWWGNFKLRHSSHEGIDITYHRTYPDIMHSFDDSIKVPAMADGIILNICDDFLGQTLAVEYEDSMLFNQRTLLVYAHIIPVQGLKAGHTIKKNQVIARVCDTYKNPQLPPHLHLSCFDVLKKVQKKDLTWNLFSNSLEVNLINPVFL